MGGGGSLVTLPLGNILGTHCTKARWAMGPVWMGKNEVAPTRVLTLNCPAHIKSLHRLCYPSPCISRALKSVTENVEASMKENPGSYEL
jgi:hypothetical protein